jgi:5-formyltetrahydrofolate cyclo-ligase
MVTSIENLKNLFRHTLKQKLASLSALEKDKETLEISKRLFDHSVYQKSRSVGVYINMATEVATDLIICDAVQNNKVFFIPHLIKNEMNMVRLKCTKTLADLRENQWKFKQLPSDQIHFSNFAFQIVCSKKLWENYLLQCKNATFTQASRIGIGFNEEFNYMELSALKGQGCLNEKCPLGFYRLYNEIDLFLVPGLGFGEKGKRLGRGKGCYDKYFFQLNQIKNFHNYYCSLHEFLCQREKSVSCVNFPKNFQLLSYKKIGLCFSVQWCPKTIPTSKHDIPMNNVITPSFVF